MPYQRESEKQQQQGAPQDAQQVAAPEPSPAAQGGDMDLEKRRITRGAMDPNTPNDAFDGFRMAQENVRPGQGRAMGEDVEASPEEQAEYERAVGALGKYLYEDEKASRAIQQHLTPGEKVGGVAKAGILLVQQLDSKFDFDEVVIPELTQETVDRLIDVYENLHGEEFSDAEAQRAFGAAWEGVMELYGMDEDEYAELTAGMSEDEFRGVESEYKQFLGEA